MIELLGIHAQNLSGSFHSLSRPRHFPLSTCSGFSGSNAPMDDEFLWSHTGALGRGEAGCFPMEVAGLWEPGPKVLGVPVCRSCTLTTRLGCMTMRPTRFILKQSQPFLHGSEILFFDIETYPHSTNENISNKWPSKVDDWKSPNDCSVSSQMSRHSVVKRFESKQLVISACFRASSHWHFLRRRSMQAWAMKLQPWSFTHLENT